MAPAAHRLNPSDSAQVTNGKRIFEERKYGESVNMGVVKLGGWNFDKKKPRIRRGDYPDVLLFHRWTLGRGC